MCFDLCPGYTEAWLVSHHWISAVFLSDSIKMLSLANTTKDIWEEMVKERWFFFSLSPLGSPKWLLLLFPHEKDDIGRGKGRTKHGSGGKGDTGQLMDSGAAPALENWGGGTQDPWMLEWTSTCFFFSDSANAISVHILCVRVIRSVSRVDKTLSLDATAPRTSQCAVEDMWSKRNPLLYFTSSFTTQIQTSFSAWALDTNALCTGIRQVPAPFFSFFFALTYFL